MREYSTEEYFIKFQVDKCPKCGSREIRENERTHQDIKYIVYICNKCKLVVGREIK